MRRVSAHCFSSSHVLTDACGRTFRCAAVAWFRLRWSLTQSLDPLFKDLLCVKQGQQCPCWDWGSASACQGLGGASTPPWGGSSMGCIWLCLGDGLKTRTLVGRCLKYIVSLRVSTCRFRFSTSKCTMLTVFTLAEVTTCWGMSDKVKTCPSRQQLGQCAGTCFSAASGPRFQDL